MKNFHLSQKKRFLLLGITLFVGIFCLGCSSDSANYVPGIPDYSGTWDVRYNFIEDHCGMAAPHILGIVDQHVIEQEGTAVRIASAGAIIGSQAGIIRDDGSVYAEAREVGDIFNEGFTCALFAAISYQDLEQDSATTMYRLNIDCGVVFACNTQAFGAAVRQPRVIGIGDEIVEEGEEVSATAN